MNIPKTETRSVSEQSAHKDNAAVFDLIHKRCFSVLGGSCSSYAALGGGFIGVPIQGIVVTSERVVVHHLRREEAGALTRL